jgi:hypothetical protein
MLNLSLLSKDGRTKNQSKEWKNAANEHCILLPQQNRGAVFELHLPMGLKARAKTHQQFVP